MLLKQGVDQMMNVVAIQLVENNYNDLCLKLYVLIINFGNDHSNYITLPCHITFIFRVLNKGS
jgi:hypothetical protein